MGSAPAYTTIALVLSAGACHQGPDTGNPFTPAGAGDETGDASSIGSQDVEPTTSTAATDPAQDDAAIVKLDVGPPEGDGGCAADGCAGPSCTAVDVLFVIDNSTSMFEHQVALAEAFPAFVDAMIAGLPPFTDLHVGVTSTEMGFSALGATMDCQATGDDGLPQEAFYVTPDDEVTEVPVAQGRLHVVDDLPFFAAMTSAEPSEIEALGAWFKDAATLGVSGSTIEMSAAAAGWAASPANASTNAGFIRDDGAVLVVFFIQDEPDQTPPDRAPELLEMIAAAKDECGGLECVVAGGLVDEGCLAGVALGAVLDALPRPSVVASLPPVLEAEPEAFEAVLAETLVDVIAQACDEIGPAG